jgi:hypothetical protein
VVDEGFSWPTLFAKCAKEDGAPALIVVAGLLVAPAFIVALA